MSVIVIAFVNALDLFSKRNEGIMVVSGKSLRILISVKNLEDDDGEHRCV